MAIFQQTKTLSNGNINRMQLTPPENNFKMPAENRPKEKPPVFTMPKPNQVQINMGKDLLCFFTELFAFTLLTGCLVVVLCTYLSQYKTAFDLGCHFLPQAAIGMLIAAITFISLRKWVFTAIAVIGLSTAIYLIYPFYQAQMPWHKEAVAIAAPVEQNIRLLQMNVLKTNTNYDAFTQYVKETQPDIIVLQETGLDWANQLWGLEKEYPYNYVIPREDGFGLSFYSKIPVQTIKTHFFGDSRKYGYLPFPSIEAEITSKSGTFTLITTHPIPPVGGYTFRNSQLQEMADYAKDIRTPLIISGDMNITPWSAHYRDLIETSGLTDTQKVSGLQPSWPVGEYVASQKDFVQEYNLQWVKGLILHAARIPIDHILVNQGIQVLERKLGPELGSDHLPVVMDFTLTK